MCEGCFFLNTKLNLRNPVMASPAQPSETVQGLESSVAYHRICLQKTYDQLGSFIQTPDKEHVDDIDLPG